MYRRSTPLPCPECRMSQKHAGHDRIGNRRNICRTCNKFWNRVNSRANTLLRKRHRLEFERLRLQVEADLYPVVLDQFKAENRKRLTNSLTREPIVDPIEVDPWSR